MKRIKIQEIDKDVYELSTGSINLMYVSGEQLRNLRDDIDNYLKERIDQSNKS